MRAPHHLDISNPSNRSNPGVTDVTGKARATTAAPPLRVAIVSSYLPRACGLATFTEDLRCAMGASLAAEVRIVAVDRSGIEGRADTMTTGTCETEEPVIARIIDNDAGSYVRAASVVNAWADVVIVQHEFGIYGGDDGELLLVFLAALDRPVMTTLHTVLPQFSFGQRRVLRAVCDHSARVTVFSSTARRLLKKQLIADPSRVAIVAHGAPSELFEANRSACRRALGLDDRFVLSSFGLMSEGKGYELAIAAMPEIVEDLPNVVLVLAGRTHPDVAQREGERYRDTLVALADRLDVADRVVFRNEFMSTEALAQLLGATDTFVTPYVNRNQIVSGALTFALAAGCPTVSTPYLYAQDQLRNGAGLVVEDRSPSAFARAVTTIGQEPALTQARLAAASVGSTLRWSEVGERMVALADACSSRRTVLEVDAG